jgi:hypothetical protein
MFDEKKAEVILNKPFPQEVIEQKKKGGRTLDYVPHAQYTKRLNEAFGLDWSFDVIEYKLLDRQAVVLGRLTVGETTKMAFGGSELAKSLDTFMNYDLADQLKAASVDALKKAASFFGLGLHLWIDAGSKNANGRTPPSQPPEGHAAPRGIRGNGSTAPLTERQLGALKAIGGAMFGETNTKTFLLHAYGNTGEGLSKYSASQAIDSLQKMSTGEGPEQTERQLKSIRRYAKEAKLTDEHTVALCKERHGGKLPSQLDMRQAHEFISYLLDMLQGRSQKK